MKDTMLTRWNHHGGHIRSVAIQPITGKPLGLHSKIRDGDRGSHMLNDAATGAGPRVFADKIGNLV
jgi:hypothetical protein